MALAVSLGDFPRQPPSNTEAEQLLIAAVVNDNDVLSAVGEIIHPDHFYEPLHRRLWNVIIEMAQTDKSVTPTMLKSYLGKAEKSGLVPSEYLAAIATTRVTRHEAIGYAKEIRSLYFRREFILLAEMMIQESYDAAPSVPAESIAAKYDAAMAELRPKVSVKPEHESFSDASFRAMMTAQDAYKRGSALVGMSTGFERLDDAIGGLMAPDLLVVAGRPGMGKTSLATNIAFNVAKAAKPDDGVTVVVSLEMSAEQIAHRITCEQSGVGAWQFRRGKVSDEDMAKYANTQHDIRHMPLKFIDQGGLSMPSLRARLKALQKEHGGLRLVVIDYLQLLTSGKAPGRNDNRYQLVTEISGGLKAMAMELDVPIIALSQLSRKVEERLLDDRRPNMGDLRESGAIEQDADIIMMIYREEYYLRRAVKSRSGDALAKLQLRLHAVEGLAEVIIAKNRHGPEVTVEMGFDAAATRFLNDPPERQESFTTTGGREPKVKGLPVALTQAVSRLRTKLDLAGRAVTVDRVGVVTALPYRAWELDVRLTYLPPGTTQKDGDKYLTKMLPTMMAEGLIERAEVDGESYVWLTNKGQNS
jgi:replicative DNA helicase